MVRAIVFASSNKLASVAHEAGRAGAGAWAKNNK